MRPRVLLAGLFHETHTFLDEHTTLADFECIEGNALLAKSGDTLQVKLIEVDQRTGKFRLSRKALIEETPEQKANREARAAQRSAEGSAGGDDRGPRRDDRGGDSRGPRRDDRGPRRY